MPPDDEDIDLADLERRAAGEPLMGPHQDELVHALIHRLCYGYPMSQPDVSMAMLLGRKLGIDFLPLEA